ncbi:Ig-like domain-containing protein [Dankookia sp. P2]|uniref:Ig-like domain-containing protein n=1 Tax=Dankookia sp. P2 TaxID=3423955 RepID=UPI003D665C2B
MTAAPAGGPKVAAGIFATALGGSVSVAADGSFTCIPKAGANGQDSFACTITDAIGRSATSTASRSIAAVAGNAVIGGTSTGAVAEDGTLTASGR